MPAIAFALLAVYIIENIAVIEVARAERDDKLVEDQLLLEFDAQTPRGPPDRSPGNGGAGRMIVPTASKMMPRTDEGISECFVVMAAF